MTRRKPQRKLSTTGRPALALSPSTEWRELVHAQGYASTADADLAEVATRLARAARWSCSGDKGHNANKVPKPSGDPSADIDAIDTWLLRADAKIDRSRYEGRRSWAWRQAMA